MTYVIADGPPDVDASHVWAPASGSAPPAINDWTADPVTFPFIRLEQISGWRAAAEADNNSIPRVGRIGEVPLPGDPRGKTLVYELEVQATSRESLRAKVSGLLAGFADRSGLGTMTVTPFSSIGGVVWTYQARALAFDPDPVFTYTPGIEGPWRCRCALSLRMLDPRFYGDTEDTGAVSTPVTVTNEGNAPTDPSMIAEIPPAADFSITNTTTGKTIAVVLPGLLAAVGGTVYLNFSLRVMAYLAPGATYPDDQLDFSYALDEQGSTWWDPQVEGLVPGANVIDAMNVTTLQVVYTHASW